MGETSAADQEAQRQGCIDFPMGDICGPSCRDYARHWMVWHQEVGILRRVQGSNSKAEQKQKIYRFRGCFQLMAQEGGYSSYTVKGCPQCGLPILDI